ncbi:carbohydrate ABC transporter permease [Bacillota bacterium Meth-B3]|nr:sugar ABC transporter permease [Christensenellaceae bacterium]MEA5068530.1 sugar ABC transporter permease [Christensenellaceae bacterium]
MATQNVPGAGQSASPSRELNTVPFKTRLRPYLIVAPALLITIGILIPFAMAIYFSLTGYTFRQPIANFVGLRNWIRMFQDDQFWNGVGVTIRYAFWSTLVEMLLGLGIAMLLDTINNRFSRVMRVALIFPLMVAPVIATIIWQLMLSSSVGIIEKFLNLFGLYGMQWGASQRTAMMTVVMIDVWVNCPFVIILILAGIQSLPKSPFESAKIDGGSAWFNFKTLTLPMLKPCILIALLFRLMAALQEFGIIFALTKGGPGDTLMSLSVTAYTRGYMYQKFSSALPFILVLWFIVNIIAKQIVKAWRKSQYQASGKELEEKPKRAFARFRKGESA